MVGKVTSIHYCIEQTPNKVSSDLRLVNPLLNADFKFLNLTVKFDTTEFFLLECYIHLASRTTLVFILFLLLATHMELVLFRASLTFLNSTLWSASDFVLGLVFFSLYTHFLW